jgi:hypothetical protein
MNEFSWCTAKVAWLKAGKFVSAGRATIAMAVATRSPTRARGGTPARPPAKRTKPTALPHH